MSDHDDECVICQACQRHGVKSEAEIAYFHQYVGMQEAMVNLIAEAEDAGVDLDAEVFTQMSDELFASDEDPMKMN